MRILLIHQVFLSSGDGGGTRHFELGRLTVKKGHDFVVVASDISYLDGKRIETDYQEEVIDGVRVLRARMLSALHRSFIWRVISFLSFMCTSVIKALRVKDVDLVMGTSPPLFQAFSAWLVSAIRRRPFLMEVRDLWPDFAIDMGVLTNPVLIWLARRLEIFLYNRADHLLVNSPAYRDYLIERGIDEKRISLIANGVDPAMFDPDADGAALRRELGLDDKFIVTYAGAIGAANDIATIIRAAERLKDQPEIHFLLVGDGKERINIEQMVDQKGLPNVTMLGLRPKSQMKELMAASNAMVATLLNIPMFTMPYPNKVFDYLAAGRPTILGIDGAIRQVVEDAKGGIFVTPGDDQALAEAARTLWSNPQQAAAMGRDGRTYVCEHFNREKQGEQFVALLEKMTAKATH